MSNLEIDQALVHLKLAAQLPPTSESENLYFELLSSQVDDWLAQHNDVAIQTVASAARADCPETLPYYMRLVRTLSGVKFVRMGDRSEYVHLVLIPWFAQAAPGVCAAYPLLPLACQAQIERGLESALDLGFAHFRLAPTPTSFVAAAQWTPSQCQQIITDLLKTGDSPLLLPGALDFAGEPEVQRTGFFWVGIWRVWSEDTERQDRAISHALTHSEALQGWKARSDELIERDLGKLHPPCAVSSKLYMPFLLPDAFQGYRLIDLNLGLSECKHFFKEKLQRVRWAFSRPRLAYRLLNGEGQGFFTNELHFPEEDLADVERAMLACGDRLNLPLDVVPWADLLAS